MENLMRRAIRGEPRGYPLVSRECFRNLIRRSELLHQSGFTICVRRSNRRDTSVSAPGRSPAAGSSLAPLRQQLEMLDNRRRVVKAVQQPLPFLKPRGLTEANRMVFDTAPLDQQQVSVRRFETSLQLMRDVSFHRRKDCLRFRECALKSRTLSGTHSQNCDFQNHFSLVPTLTNTQGYHPACLELSSRVGRIQSKTAQATLRPVASTTPQTL